MSQFHVHVGAGKLGLSLVVPALADKNHDFAAAGGAHRGGSP